VAREHGVSHSTAARWFAEAGLLGADPKADTGQLVELYVHQRLTTREVAAELGISKDRAIRAFDRCRHPPPGRGRCAVPAGPAPRSPTRRWPRFTTGRA